MWESELFWSFIYEKNYFIFRIQSNSGFTPELQLAAMDDAQYLSVHFLQGCDRRLALLKMYKSVVLDLLHAFDLAVGFEALLQFFFRYLRLQVPHVKHLHLDKPTLQLAKVDKFLLAK